MAFNFQKNLESLEQRKYGDDIRKGTRFRSFSGKIPDEILYVSEAMKPVSRDYTKSTYEQCDRVINHLTTNVSSKHSGIQFEYQGSVPLNLHIRRHSDIDILVATGRYHWLKAPLTPTVKYHGNPADDLLQLRSDVVETIERTFPAVLIDNNGGKSVAISGGSLNRKIDLVPVSWVQTIDSNITSNLTHRGIKLYDIKDQCKHPVQTLLI